jgi:hypothetical protein
MAAAPSIIAPYEHEVTIAASAFMMAAMRVPAARFNSSTSTKNSCASRIASITSGAIIELPYRDSGSNAPITGRTPNMRV